MLKSLYHWMLEKSRHPKAGVWLASISLLESFIFPIPPDIMLIPMALANRQKAFWFAFLCTLGAAIGAGFGYAIGYFFFDIAGEHIIMLYNKGDTFKNIQEQFIKYDWLVILVAAITPIPFKIATITAGFVQTNFLIFILAAILGRSIRYGSISLLIVLFGQRIEQFLENHFNLVLAIGGVIFVAGWLLII